MKKISTLLLATLLSGCSLAGTNQSNTPTTTALTNNTNSDTEVSAGTEIHAHGQEGERYQLKFDTDPTDPQLAIISLYDTVEKKDLKEFKVKDAAINQAHAAEYHDNGLFVIVRPGGDEYVYTHPDWQDELWFYREDGTSTKLYSGQGIEFRTSHLTGDVGILSGHTATILTEAGDPINTVQITSGTPNSIAGWTDDALWLLSDDEDASNPNQMITFGFTKVLPVSGTQQFFPVPGISSHTHDLAIHPSQNLIVTSDAPMFHDTEEFAPAGTVVNMYSYDLDTQQRTNLVTITLTEDTSGTIHFSPIWLNDTTLEYSDPITEERLTYDTL